MKLNPWPAVRVAAGAVFIWSGSVKLLAPPEQFAATIERFEWVSGAPVTVLSLVLPWIELVGGAHLALGLWTGWAASVLWAMDSVFLVALVSVLLRKLPVEECGCFGEGLSLSVKRMVLLDSVLWLALAGTWARRARAAAFGLDGVWKLKAESGPKDASDRSAGARRPPAPR